MGKKLEETEIFSGLSLDQITDQISVHTEKLKALEEAARTKAETGLEGQISDALASAKVLARSGHAFSRSGEAASSLRSLVKEIYGSEYKIARKSAKSDAGASEGDAIKDVSIVVKWLADNGATSAQNAKSRSEIESGVGASLKGHYWNKRNKSKIKQIGKARDTKYYGKK